MSDSTASPDSKDSLLGELESMLLEQAEISPGDLRVRLRLARMHAEMQRKEVFIEDARQVHRLVKGEAKHPALIQLRDLAQQIGVDLNQIGKPPQNRPQRRLGEDAASKAYFEHIHAQYRELSNKAEYLQQHDRMLLRNFNRPSSLMHAKRWSQQLGGAQIAIKREDMMGGGSKLVMAVVGQVVLARQLGYSTVVTGSRNSRTGLIMSTMAARLGLKSVVYMDETSATQNSSNVLQMRCVGARIETVNRHSSARDAAVDDCVALTGKHFLVLGVDATPSPFPDINQLLISTLGRETRAQAQSMFKKVPDLIVARGRKTADALGLFDPFLSNKSVRLVAIDAQDSLKEDNGRSDPFKPQLALSDAQLFQAEAILEGSEYPAVTREHNNYDKSGRVEYKKGSSADAQSAIKALAHHEGLITPIRTAYALGWAAREAKHMTPEQLVVVNMIEPFDKDLRDVAQALGHSTY